MDLPGAHMSSTFGGNPVCAAAALACINVLEEEQLVERSATLGEKLAKELETIADRHRHYINWVDGRGLFRSIHLKDPVTGESLPDLVNEMTTECIRRGVMLFHTGRFFKIVPPLIIEEDALFEAVGVIGEVFDDYLK
jgi:4-aminobutyrate aminotransferase-like enzyme